MLNKYPVLRCMTKFVLPFIIFFAIYVQINGETSPGGGFQAGSIFASCMIALHMVANRFGSSYKALRNMTTSGVLIYALMGLAPVFLGYQYLDYYALAKDPHFAQKVGIFMIEIGVGLTISAGMLLIYFLFDVEYSDKE